MKLENSRHIFEKFSNIKFHENPSSERHVFQCGQMVGRTGKHEKANSRFPQFLKLHLRTFTTQIYRRKYLSAISLPSLIKYRYN